MTVSQDALVLARLVATREPWESNPIEDDRPMCFYCGKRRAMTEDYRYARPGESDPTVHYDSCAWELARSIVKRRGAK